MPRVTVPLLRPIYDRHIGVPKFLRSPPRAGRLDVDAEPATRLDLVSVAFNNPKMVATQVSLLASRLEDPYELCVVDNSSDEVVRTEIGHIASAAGVHCVQPPALPASIQMDPSLSHGLTLTWAYWNWLAPRRVEFVGTLDHDVFPMRPTSLLESLHGQALWGLPQARPDDPRTWYPWPGLTVIDSRKLDLSSVDLRPDPSRGYDTGGGLADTQILDGMSPVAKPEVAHRYERFDGSNDPQSGFVELIDDWVHVMNGSRWADSPWTRGKTKFVERLAAEGSSPRVS